MFGVIASSQFNPRTLSTIRNWYDASDVRGNLTSTSDATTMTGWTDKSGNNNNISQTTAGFQPVLYTNQVNGKPSIRFDGTDDYFNAPSNMVGNGCVVAVWQVRSAIPIGQCTGLLSGYSPSTVDDYNSADASCFLVYCNSLEYGVGATKGPPPSNAYNVTVAPAPVTYPTNFFCLIANFDFSDGCYTYAIDNSGSQLTAKTVSSGSTTNPFNFNNYTIGCRRTGSTFAEFQNGAISEMFCYSRFVTNAEIDSLKSYLRMKYGFTNLV
jgi:hypothetical protein